RAAGSHQRLAGHHAVLLGAVRHERDASRSYARGSDDARHGGRPAITPLRPRASARARPGDRGADRDHRRHGGGVGLAGGARRPRALGSRLGDALGMSAGTAPPCLLSYAFATAPSPLQASSASAESPGMVEIWVSAGTGTIYCSEIILAVKIGTDP